MKQSTEYRIQLNASTINDLIKGKTLDFYVEDEDTKIIVTGIKTDIKKGGDAHVAKKPNIE